MKSTDEKTQKGEAFNRLLTAIVSLAPRKIDRQLLLESAALVATHQSDSSLNTKLQALSAAETRNAAKLLGREISNGSILETLHLNGKSPKIGLQKTAFIAVKVNTEKLNQDDHTKWESDKEKAKESNLQFSDPEPTQELVSERIRDKTIRWILDKKSDAGFSVLLEDIWILHGSTSIDLLMMVKYSTDEGIDQYVREVVQRTKRVQGTQTLTASDGLSALLSNSNDS